MFLSYMVFFFMYYPRRQKLAVKIDRNEPSSRLKIGKYYLHVHQIKIYNPALGTRWLGTGRLIRKLINTFGAKYHPKQKLMSQQKPSAVQFKNLSGRRKAPHSIQTPVFRRYQHGNDHQNYTPIPVHLQHNQQFVPQLNLAYKPTPQNPCFFQTPAPHGMG